MLENLSKKIKQLNNKQKIIVIIVGFILAIIVLLFLYKIFYVEDEELIIENNNQENFINVNEMENKESKIGIKESKKTVTVHVIGEVNSPGVVTLEEGSRIIDAINMAGGKTEDADLTKVNLAYVIEDGVQIYIPSISETSKISKEEGEETIEYMIDGPGEGIIMSSASQDKEEEKQVMVNINTANIEKLQTLPGIGESIASKIIEYREQNGKFKTIEDLKNVSGIGESKFSNLKDKITV